MENSYYEQEIYFIKLILLPEKSYFEDAWAKVYKRLGEKIPLYTIIFMTMLTEAKNDRK